MWPITVYWFVDTFYFLMDESLSAFEYLSALRYDNAIVIMA